MDKYLYISRISGGFRIKDSITDIACNYYGYTLNQAIRKHRDNFNVRYKHFEKIFI